MSLHKRHFNCSILPLYTMSCVCTHVCYYYPIDMTLSCYMPGLLVTASVDDTIKFWDIQVSKLLSHAYPMYKTFHSRTISQYFYSLVICTWYAQFIALLVCIVVSVVVVVVVWCLWRTGFCHVCQVLCRLSLFTGRWGTQKWLPHHRRVEASSR